MITSEIKDSALFIFANYNSVAPYRAEPGIYFKAYIIIPRLINLKPIEDFDPIPRPSYLYSRCEFLKFNGSLKS